MLILWIVFHGEDDDTDIEYVDFSKFVVASNWLVCWNCMIMDGPAMLHGLYFWLTWYVLIMYDCIMVDVTF